MNKKSTNKSMPKDNRPPKHLRTLKRGDTREDGMIFFCYKASSINGEIWYPKDKYNKVMKRRSQTSKSWAKKNRKKLNDYHRKFRKDPLIRIMQNTRIRIVKAMKDSKKANTTIDLLGCTPNELREYLESKFTEGMTLDNHGKEGWHIDHIRPCASFDLSDPKQQEECFHYTNLQPLWAKDNYAKGSHYNPQTED